MLIEFTVGNFRSFKEPVTLSLVAANTKARDPQVNQNNTIALDEKLTLLTSAAVYGANASGKSNLVAALARMREFVLESSRESRAEEPIDHQPFLLNTATENQPSLFQVIFRLNDRVTYRYGFEIDAQRVQAEWLFQTRPDAAKEERLFARDSDEIRVARAFKEGTGLKKKTRPNALFLSVAAQWNGPTATRVLQWFDQLNLILGLSDLIYRGYTAQQFANGLLKEKILEFVKELDLGIADILSEEVEDAQLPFPKNVPPELKAFLLKSAPERQVVIKTTHPRWDADGNLVAPQVFELAGQESEGTQKLFYLAGPVLETLLNGGVLVIDEMEARLHPLIARAIIQKFNALETNPRRAQLVFTTHDTNLLSNKAFRRDQIWFIEKDRMGCSHLYSLAELKVRNDASFEKDYIEGRYGAIPYLGKSKSIVLDEA